jgi:hypothetical protein
MGYAMAMTDTRKKNAAAVALGRLGGKKRAATLPPEELSLQGKRAAAARWAKSKSTVGSSEEHVQNSEKPELVPMPEPAKMAEATQVRESNVILALKEQGYEVGEPAVHPDGFMRVAVRSRDVFAWVSMGIELLDLAAGRVTLEEIMNRRRSEHRSAAAAGEG